MTGVKDNHNLLQERAAVNVLIDKLTLFDGHLMSDFHQTDSSNMYYDTLAQGVQHFKENQPVTEIIHEYSITKRN